MLVTFSVSFEVDSYSVLAASKKQVPELTTAHLKHLSSVAQR